MRKWIVGGIVVLGVAAFALRPRGSMPPSDGAAAISLNPAAGARDSHRAERTPPEAVAAPPTATAAAPEERRLKGSVRIDGAAWTGEPRLRIESAAGIANLAAEVDGRYSTTMPAAGPCALAVLAPLGWQPAAVFEQRDDRTRDFDLAFGDLTVVVFYPAGEGFRPGTVELHRDEAGLSGSALSSRTEDESVLFEMVPAGSWRATFASDDGRWEGASGGSATVGRGGDGVLTVDVGAK